MSLGQDLRFALRGFRRNPAFTALALATLAIGIGANTAIFSVVNAVMLRPLPYERPEQLVHLFRTQRPIERAMFSLPAFRDLAGQQKVFQSFAAHHGVTFNLTGSGQSERLVGRCVTAEFFPLFGVRPALGRFLQAADDQPGSPGAAVISHGLWQRRFGGVARVIGQPIVINGGTTTIVGVAPPQFRFPEDVEIWTPARLAAQQRGRGDNFLRIVARLRDGVSPAQAAAQMNQIAAALALQYPANHQELSILIAPMLQDQVRNIRWALWILLGAVGVVLLIACANVASLLLARATVRQREFAVRAALGAGGWRIARQLLIECLLLGVGGGALGILLALWGLETLMAFAPADLPRAADIGVDRWVLGFTVLVSLLTGTLFGLAPAWQAARANHGEALKQGGRTVAGGGKHASLRRALVVVEIALSLVLLVGAGLLIGSVRRLLAVSPGFETAHLLTAQIAYPRRASAATKSDVVIRQRAERIAFVRALEQAAAAVPGVEAVGAISDLPVTGDGAWNGSFKIEGAPDIEWATAPVADRRFVTPSYFSAAGIPLLRGRNFSDADGPEVAERLPILINETLARRFFPGQDPVGKRLLVMDGPNEIVGVVGDARQWGPARPTTPDVYFSLRQRPGSPELALVVRTTADPASLAGPLRRALEAIAPDAPVFRMRTMKQVVATAVAQERFNMIAMATFAGLALLLALVGLYGVMSYSVAQRVHEIGVRVALGAQTRDVLRLVVGQAMRLALLGVILGLAASSALAGLLEKMLFGVAPHDPLTFGGVALLLIVVALLASYLPARRAARVDPMVALRAD
jgi:putative ABC transport system permease protein